MQDILIPADRVTVCYECGRLWDTDKNRCTGLHGESRSITMLRARWLAWCEMGVWQKLPDHNTAEAEIFVPARGITIISLLG